MGIGSHLRDLRLARGLTQRELAEPYYTHAYVSRIEAGARRASPEALEHFALKLGVTADELRNGRAGAFSSQAELELRELRKQISAGKGNRVEPRLEEIRARARDETLASVEAKAVFALGLCAERKGRLEDAIELYEEARTLQPGERHGTAIDAVAGEARCRLLLGDIRYAIHILESELQALERDGLVEPGSVLRIHAALIGAYFEVGLYEHAYKSAEEALRLAPQVSDPERLATMYLNAGWALSHRGRAKDALAVLERADILFTQIDLKLEIGRARLARGMMLARGKKWSSGSKELTAACSVFQEVGSPVDEARARNELGRLLCAKGSNDQAVAHLEAALELLGRTRAEGLEARTNRELGLCLAEDDPARAVEYLNKAIALFESAGEKPQAAATYGYVGELLERQRKKREAYDAYRNGMKILQETV